MKKLLFFAVCIAVFWCSCAKSNKSTIAPSNSFSAKIDGVSETFTFRDTAQNTNPAFLYIAGVNEVTSDRVMLVLISPTAIVPGTYSSHSANSSGLEMMYGIGPGYTYNNYYYTYDIHNGPTFEGTITITSIDKNGVKGTFSGNLVLEASVVADSGTYQSKNITEGQFDLTFK